MIVPYIVLAAAGAIVEPISFDQLSDEQAMIDYMNSVQPFETETPKMSYKDFESRLMNPEYLEDSKEEKLLMTAPIVLAAERDDIDIPESFDARERWPECESIKLIRDQANCGSCWAVSVASVMSDRLCIASNQAIQTLLSATDIISCCNDCATDPCDGGHLLKAWAYIRSHGVCSGGPYNRKNVCKPYVYRPCSYYSKEDKIYYGPCNGNKTPIPTCQKKCLQDYKTSYAEDKVYGNYYPVPPYERNIQKEIMTFGPVQARMKVYKDFYNRTGIYYHKYDPDEKFKFHAVKIIGWGVENVKNVKWKYWLVSNSWGDDWRENGLFRIVRGVHGVELFNCEIESQVKIVFYHDGPNEGYQSTWLYVSKSNNEWMLDGITSKTYVTYGSTGENGYYMAAFTLQLRRASMIYILIIIIPSFALTFLCILGMFWSEFDHSDYLDKIECGFTTILSMFAILQIAEGEIPKTKEVPILSIYIMVNFLIVAVAITVVIVASNSCRLPKFMSCLSKGWFQRMVCSLGANSRVICLLVFPLVSTTNLLLIVSKA